MAGVKLNSLEKTMSKALTDVGKFKSHEKFKVVNNEAVNYCRLKGNIGTNVNKKCSVKRDTLIQLGNMIDINQIIKQN